MFRFDLIKTEGHARRGRLTLNHDARSKFSQIHFHQASLSINPYFFNRPLRQFCAFQGVTQQVIGMDCCGKPIFYRKFLIHPPSVYRQELANIHPCRTGNQDNRCPGLQPQLTAGTAPRSYNGVDFPGRLFSGGDGAGGV
ncbi:hypothetical protein [Desulfofustis glycolicus]|uniref:hypothetical protein n=1 Tax=Desulfofustis glycolicus TaxID=51195 RepID=UPI001160F192|nr:hypothetical protein [Desulfofustis glycolicus]MCB2215225.1 hypothetical protein [Desulfobulbaceae bacterium]